MPNYKSQTAIANAQDFDTTFTNEYDKDQTNANILTPTSGTRLAIKGIYANTEATTGTLRFIIDNNTVVSFFANAQSGYIPVNIKGLRNSPLKITTTVADDKNYFVLVNYREE